MIKKTQNHAPRKPRGAVLTKAGLTVVAGGDPPPTKIKDTLVGD